MKGLNPAAHTARSKTGCCSEAWNCITACSDLYKVPDTQRKPNKYPMMQSVCRTMWGADTLRWLYRDHWRGWPQFYTGIWATWSPGGIDATVNKQLSIIHYFYQSVGSLKNQKEATDASVKGKWDIRKMIKKLNNNKQATLLTKLTV